MRARLFCMLDKSPILLKYSKKKYGFFCISVFEKSRFLYAGEGALVQKRRRYKLPGIIWMSQAVLTILMATIMAAGVTYFGTYTVDTTKAETMGAAVDNIGRALMQYSRSHRQIFASDVRVKDLGGEKEHIYAPSRPLFPKDEAEFKEIRDNLGYFTQFSMNGPVDNDIFDKIHYSTNADRTDFKLEVTYPNGKTYSVTKANFLDNGRADPES